MLLAFWLIQHSQVSVLSWFLLFAHLVHFRNVFENETLPDQKRWWYNRYSSFFSFYFYVFIFFYLCQNPCEKDRIKGKRSKGETNKNNHVARCSTADKNNNKSCFYRLESEQTKQIQEFGGYFYHHQ